MKPELISLNVSPFSDRSKWVLKHHKIDYKRTEHLIIFGNPLLRIKLKKISGKVTVPVYIDGEVKLMDSFDIAIHVNRKGTGGTLFPHENVEKIKQWNSISEDICNAGRAIVTQKVTQNKDVLKFLLPPQIPPMFKGSLTSLVTVGTNYLTKKYQLNSKTLSEREEDLRTALLKVRDGLKNSKYLLGAFTYADITIACALQMLTPYEKSFLGKNSELKKCWTHDKLASEFSDLLQWRDEVYKNHG
jgi:glutathione S-transferase